MCILVHVERAPRRSEIRGARRVRGCRVGRKCSVRRALYARVVHAPGESVLSYICVVYPITRGTSRTMSITPCGGDATKTQLASTAHKMTRFALCTGHASSVWSTSKKQANRTHQHRVEYVSQPFEQASHGAGSAPTAPAPSKAARNGDRPCMDKAQRGGRGKLAVLHSNLRWATRPRLPGPGWTPMLALRPPGYRHFLLVSTRDFVAA